MNPIKTVSFPRSGNTFLNYAIRDMFYPDFSGVVFFHTEKAVLNLPKLMSCVRDPLDSLSSWALFYANTLDKHISYYLRLNKTLLANKHKIIFMDFDCFIVDLSYIQQKTEQHFEVTQVANPTIESIKHNILQERGAEWLPRNNEAEKQIIKNKIIEHSAYNEIMDLHFALKELV